MYIEKPGEDQAERELHRVHEKHGRKFSDRRHPRFFPSVRQQAVQNHLGQHKHGIQKECGIAKIVTPDGGNTV